MCGSRGLGWESTNGLRQGWLAGAWHIGHATASVELVGSWLSPNSFGATPVA
jgi:hypothetical protein